MVRASSRNANKLTLMCTAECVTEDDSIPFSDQILDSNLQVGEGIQHHNTSLTNLAAYTVRSSKWLSCACRENYEPIISNCVL